MKYENKYYCDDCETEMNEINKFGLHDICDKCELSYQNIKDYFSQIEEKK